MLYFSIFKYLYNKMRRYFPSLQLKTLKMLNLSFMT